MATLDSTKYVSGAPLAEFAGARVLEQVVDFTESGNQVASAADSLQLFELPKGTVVLAAGIEQLVAGSAGSTATARVGTTALSGTLASDAAVGTHTANAAVDTQVIAAAADFNLLIGTAVRSTGKVRAWVKVAQGTMPQGVATIAARDALA